MNRLLFSRLSRKNAWVWLLLATILAFNFAIRWRLRDLPLERDEGEYAYAGQLILQGIPPYQIAYNMKFPGVYFAYAALMAVFGESTAGLHLGIMVVTSVSAFLIFLIGLELTSEAGGLLAAATFICLAALPKAAGLAGHATHFVCLFVCAGALALLMARKKNSFTWWWAASGGAFGLAVLMTQQALFFPVFILAVFFWKTQGSRKNTAAAAVAFGAGCALPFLGIAVILAHAGVWDKFVFWTFQYARQYVSMFPLRLLPEQFALGFGPVFESGMWVWASGIIGLAFLFRKSESNKPAALAGILFLAGMAAVFPGFYFRNHYFIMAMPGLSLLNAVFIFTVAETVKKPGTARILKLLPLLFAGFILGNLITNNCRAWFATTPTGLSRQLYGFNPFPESISIAAYLKRHTSPEDKIAVLGSEPELYFLSGRHSASGYLYLYPLTEPQPLASQMQKEFFAEIENARPGYVVYVDYARSWYSVVLPQSLQSAAVIQQWWGDYSTNYLLAGAVKMSQDQPSEFVWDQELANHPEATNDEILIYRRK